ncbi:MAG TPA: S8 family serine peptidase, partial [Patescibacteria group bacterium]
MIKKILPALLLTLFLAAFAYLKRTPSITAQAKSDVIPQNYIVVLNDNVADPSSVANEHARLHGLALGHIYKSVIKGYSAVISDQELAKIKSDPRVKFVSQDHRVTIEAPAQSASTRKPVKVSPTPTLSPAQTTPTGVGRIGLNASNKGKGVGVAVIDTGIDLTHPDLAANIVANTTCVARTNDGNDDNGHGSHVAGTIAAVDNTIGVVGVAPQAKLIAVKVLDSSGNGSWSSVICGIDWVTSNASRYNIKVANMSLGGSGSGDNNCGLTNNDALHQAICNSTKNSGVAYVVAAGNNGTNTSGFVPAAYDDTVITVSALADS